MAKRKGVHPLVSAATLAPLAVALITPQLSRKHAPPPTPSAPIVTAGLSCTLPFDAIKQHHPIDDPAALRALAEEVTRMPPSAAQVRALGALARLHIADRGILDELARAFADSKSVKVQRAIAEVFIRSDPAALPRPQLASLLRSHRVKSPDGRPDLIDTLISSLQAGA